MKLLLTKRHYSRSLISGISPAYLHVIFTFINEKKPCLLTYTFVNLKFLWKHENLPFKYTIFWLVSVLSSTMLQDYLQLGFLKIGNFLTLIKLCRIYFLINIWGLQFQVRWTYDFKTCNDKNSPSESNFNPMFEAVEAAAASKE